MRTLRTLATGSTGRYGRRYKKMLMRWWMAGWRGETQGYHQIGTNFEAPLRLAWREGGRARRKS